VRKDYGIQTNRVGKPPAYFVHHSSFVYLVDRAGKLRAMMPYGVSVDDIAHDVKALLAQ
jgi:protein SCO1/2